jgi:hypothetical protein
MGIISTWIFGLKNIGVVLPETATANNKVNVQIRN